MRAGLRVSLLTVLFFTAYSGVVMASSTACRVAVVEQLHSAQAVFHRRAHHSAATLARWKVGAAAWSKAHGGRVYAGLPAPRRQDWTPLRFNCDDVALDLSRADQGLLVPSADVPEFAMEEREAPFGSGLDLAASTIPPVMEAWERAGTTSGMFAPPLGSPGTGAGNTPDGPVGPASFPPAPVYPPLAAPVPTPESPTIVLLGTGMLSFLVTRLRRRTVV